MKNLKIAAVPTEMRNENHLNKSAAPPIHQPAPWACVECAGEGFTVQSMSVQQVMWCGSLQLVSFEPVTVMHSTIFMEMAVVKAARLWMSDEIHPDISVAMVVKGRSYELEGTYWNRCRILCRRDDLPTELSRHPNRSSVMRDQRTEDIVSSFILCV